MSIKDLFGSTNKPNNYLADTTDKETFRDVESSRNAKAISEKQNTYIPQVDYSKPENFAKYGSAYLYYKSAVERIIDYYPYDGSDAEVNEFYNRSLEIEKYIFDNLYPRTNGYAILCADGWGSLDGSIVNGYGKPATLENITFYGGPNTITATTTAKLFQNPSSSNTDSANIYDTDIYKTARLPSTYGTGSRESNLKSNFTNGVTVEFWLKTGSLDASLTEKQVIFDMWNNVNSSSADYGRVTVALTSSATSPFLITVQSGTTGIFEQSIGATVKTGSLSDWKHYGLSFYNKGSDLVAKLYVNGQLDDTNTYSSKALNEINSKKMKGRLGALLISPSGTAGAPSSLTAAGKLSGSIDEFRFWKVRRNSHEIGKNWFTHIRGGVNTDISNATLGVYYKFNEGITQTSSVDSVVLDYSGRISNGTWTGYNGTTSRNTGSAMVSASAASVEYPDPIIRSSHSDVVTLKSNLTNSGSYHDSTNISSMLSMIPSWIVEEQEAEDGNIQIISHIIGTYFDKLHLLISELPKFRSQTYTSSSYKPLPFAQHMPQSLGLYTPEIFIDSDVLERFMNRTQTTLFESDLNDMKNMIYLNLYNNLTNIYKSKGTEKAIRNVLRCFNIDEKVVRLNAYSNDQTYDLRDNLIQVLTNKTSLNLNHKFNTSGTVYQAQNSSNSDSLGYISGSQGSGYENKYGFTIEADVLFPSFQLESDAFDRNYTDVSLFGMHTVNTGSADSLTGVNTTWLPLLDYANFQVLAIKSTKESKNVYFKLTSSNSPSYFPELTSSTFFSVYDNDRWNLSVRLRPSNYPVTEIVSGSGGSDGGTYTYDLVFRGVNTNLGEVKDSFTLTGSLTKLQGAQVLRSAKRIYVGAHKTNITGATLKNSDVLFSNIKYWTKYIGNDDLNQHLFDIDNRGTSGSYREISPKDSNDGNLELLNLNTLALDWDFNNVTSSNTDGTFNVTDMSSGSAFIRNNYGWLGNITGYQLTGKGKGFHTSSAEVISSDAVNSFKFIDPEMVISSDMVQILSEDDKLFGIEQTVPNFVYALEKSMHGAISEEMLKFFAGVIDFNNIIGEPVNRYRHRYKALEKLREIFFRKVTEVKHIEKYLDYYKWFDDSLAAIVAQLMPASSEFNSDILNVVESHVLERNKYKTQFPTLEFQPSDPAAAMSGIEELLYPFPEGSTSLPSSNRRTNIREAYWHLRAERDAPETTSGVTRIDVQRGKIRDVVAATPNLSQSLPVVSTVSGVRYKGRGFHHRRFAKTYNLDVDRPGYRTLKGGTNFNENKNIHFTYTALYPAGPVDRTDGAFIPLNVLIAHDTTFVGLKEAYKERQKGDKDLAASGSGTWTQKKVKRRLKVEHGRDWQDGLGYNSLKSSFAFPFNILSSSITTGYNKRVRDKLSASLEITNLHHDAYGPDMEIPMQGPFTNYAVGGHQSRHIALNKSSSARTGRGVYYVNGLDGYLNRPEAWKILLGRCVGVSATTGYGSSGSIGMVGPDYPWPEANDVGARPYPMTASQKAIYYRDHVAKRPVNIRNIHHTTGSSTVLGNYNQQYEIVNTVGAYSNPRRLVDQQPVFTSSVDRKKANVISNFTTLHRTDDGHFDFYLQYTPTQFTGSDNRSVIVNRFSAPGGPEIMSRGFQDLRGSEFSPYNNVNYRNLTVLKPSQGPSGSISEATGSTGIPGIRVYDIHTKDFGLRSHLARHTARFGRDSLWITGTTAVIDGPGTTAGAPGASLNQYPGFHKVHRNRKRTFRITNDGTLSEPKTVKIISSSQYDNFYVQHQIPRSDKQYSWFTGSLGTESWTDLRYASFAPIRTATEGFYSTSAGYIPYFNFVTSSFLYGATKNSVPYTYIIQPTNRLNTIIIDPVSGATDNLIGFGNVTGLTPKREGGVRYFNGDITASFNTPTDPFSPRSANYFNALMAHRGNTFGWNWKKNRQSNNPILLKERKDNAITAISGSDNKLVKYRLTPVSMKGRPTYVNFLVDGTNNATLKATNNNLEIFFDENRLDELCFSSLGEITTPFDDAWDTLKANSYTVNWVLYSEALYPSLYNEFYTSSINRIAYDNRYWRDLRTDRDFVGFRNATSFSQSLGRITNNVLSISQSCWPLDAQADFLTRTEPPLGSTWAYTQVLMLSGGAGELQNNYFHAFPTVPFVTKDFLTVGSVTKQRKKVKSLSPGALYARKHMNLHPHSVVAPSGIEIPQRPVEVAKSLNDIYAMKYWIATGSGVMSAHPSKYYIQLYAGEAYWDAPANAGILVKNDAKTNFESHPSKPWFSKYEDFGHDLKLIAKDFTVVPEFRISEHVDDYLKHGLFNKGKFDTFEIPGTGINSSNSTFYKDYSNSDFMNNFLNIKEQTSLAGAEIKLVCSAAIRLNPYKGFYPAQRTLDLVSQFSRSFAGGFEATGSDVFSLIGATYPRGGTFTSNQNPTTPQQLIRQQGGALRPLMQSLFAPGILYNSIKSGMAVDYPIVSLSGAKYNAFYGLSMKDYNALADPGGKDDYPDYIAGAADASRSFWAITCDPYAYIDNSLGWDGSGSFFDFRVPFEAIIEPGKTLNNVAMMDMEPHPSASLNVTASMSLKNADKTYSKMASNFFGEVGNFFLKDKTYTKLQSGIVSDDLKFKSGSVYGARLKMRRSLSGSRTYTMESGAYDSNNSNVPYSDIGGALFTGAAGVSQTSRAFFKGSGYPLPQDPRQNESLYETFTMYSRPSAFGPNLAGRPTGSEGTMATIDNASPVDCFGGFNWAYTPPYYHGESWVDFIFRPVGNRTYDLDTILAEIETVHWRVDAGVPIRTVASSKRFFRPLLPDFIDSKYDTYVGPLSAQAVAEVKGRHRSPYSARCVNANSMQLSASVNLFGVESVSLQEMDKFGTQTMARNTTIGKRWVIQPKFETPMMNFCNEPNGTRPILTASWASETLTLPTGYGTSSVPRGMWHQFGIIEPDPTKGIFLEIGDIPNTWLRNHYYVNLSSSIYNDYDVHNKGHDLHNKMKSLTDLFSFEEDNASVRLGELPEFRTLKEAVVAVPYVLENSGMDRATQQRMSTTQAATMKKFIEISEERYNSAKKTLRGTLAGDSLDTAGKSIRTLLQKMERYILPPQFDFINNDSVTPIVMYMFEFEYKLDKDDLSYIWQNLAPRNYKKMEFQVESTSHELLSTELLDEDNIMDNENLRWMVFKVKQKGQTDYFDQVVPQVSTAGSNAAFDLPGPLSNRVNTRREDGSDDYPIAFNWPYDYVSFVELIKFEAEVLYKNPEGSAVEEPQTTPAGDFSKEGATSRRGTLKS